MGAKRGKRSGGKGGGKQPSAKKSAGLQRLALAVFAILLIGLFVGFAIAEGIGQPSVPAGAVAIVKGVPSDVGTVSEADFKRAVLQQVASGGLKKPPKPGSKKGEEIKKAALGEVLDAIWIQGEAEEMGISVTKKQILTELAQIKKQNFKTEKAFQEFLKTSHFTKQDVLDRVKLQLLSTQIQEAVTKEAPTPSSGEISDYYDAAKSTQFTTKPTRDIRLVANKKKKEVAKAALLLKKAHTPADWKKVVKKYSSEPSSASKGGLQEGISEEVLKEPLKAAIFKSPTGTVVGPINYEGTNYVIEVVKLNPEKVQTLAEVKSQISTQLTQQAQQEFFSEFVAGYQSKWTSRTFCASGYVTERCANYVGSGHPASAPPACYEANPKGGTPKECPAPVTQAKPALPGTVTVLKPTGEQLAQRPRPEGLKEGEEGAVTLPEGATSGAAGAAPEG